MVSSESPLSRLQEDLLVAFFDRAEGFFLTGDAALARFYLHHRATDDLDLFATPDADFESGVRALLATAAAVGAAAVELRTSADFRRYALSRSAERCLVDLVMDRAPQVADKVSFGRVRVDSQREIACNKLCALFDRQEPRDLFDLRLLLDGGLSLIEVLDDAARKHAGVDPASLAWALSGFRLPPTAPIPPGTTADELDVFRHELMDQLTRLALPKD